MVKKKKKRYNIFFLEPTIFNMYWEDKRVFVKFYIILLKMSVVSMPSVYPCNEHFNTMITLTVLYFPSPLAV